MPGDQRTEMALAGAGAVDGATVYAGNCVACHQGNGLGIAGAFPPLDGSGWVNAEPELLVQILLHGVQGEMEVLGNVYNGVMPAMAHLSDEELAAVSTYIRTSWSNASGEVDAALFAEQRERFDAGRGPWAGGAELKAEGRRTARRGGRGQLSAAYTLEPSLEGDSAERTLTESTFAVADMFCGGCAATVERALERLPGVHEVTVSFLSDSALVRHEPERISAADIAARLAELGYETRPGHEGRQPSGAERLPALPRHPARGRGRLRHVGDARRRRPLLH